MRDQQRRKELMIGISILAPLGSSALQKAMSGKAVPEVEETASMAGIPTLLNQIGEVSCACDHHGRYDVIGSAEMARTF